MTGLLAAGRQLRDVGNCLILRVRHGGSMYPRDHPGTAA